LIVLDAGNVLDDALAVWRPQIDAEDEVRPHYRHPFRPTTVFSPVCKFSAVTVLCGYLRLSFSATSMAVALSSRYVRGVPSIETSNAAPRGFLIAIAPAPVLFRLAPHAPGFFVFEPVGRSVPPQRQTDPEAARPPRLERGPHRLTRRILIYRAMPPGS